MGSSTNGAIEEDSVEENLLQPALVGEKLNKDSRKSEGCLHKKKSSKSTPHHACTQCGATHTPQWRQGPLGPKTLCNACGVSWSRKKTREDRELFGHEVSNDNESTPMAPHSVPDDVTEHPAVRKTLRIPKPRKRYHPDSPMSCQQPDLQLDLPATDSGEESSWSPSHVTSTLFHVPQGYSQAEAMAAVNLLSMSVGTTAMPVMPRSHSLSVEEQMKVQAPAFVMLKPPTAAHTDKNHKRARTSPPYAQLQATPYPLVAPHHPTSASCRVQEFPMGCGANSKAARLPEHMPADQLVEFLQRREAAEAAYKELAAANAAVETLQQLLRVREAAALDAQSNAINAAQQLLELMHSIKQECPLLDLEPQQDAQGQGVHKEEPMVTVAGQLIC